ncbi:MAG: hypothetical protein QM579_03590 [Desulfovibrio sp.]|uniref:hypothetical protein n=1 Tax=Desulfovibrio sp. TaxID=885 RepID=UPI0039E60C7C
MSDFGIVITCCASDAHYARACVCSIRHFWGEVPICLFVDGDTGVFSSATRIPGVTVMSNNDLRDPWLRKHCRGWGHTKMALLWESPFERFLYLDADTLAWGNLLEIVKSLDYDFIVDRQYSYSDAEIRRWFFDPDKLLCHYPDFNYVAYRDSYACNGTFFARRGALDLELYKQTYALQQMDDSIFYPADMGMWNFLVFYSAQKLGLNVVSQQYQVIPVDHSEKKLRESYSPQALTEKKALPPAVLHFCGKKPHSLSRSAKMAAMNYFRLRYLTEVEKKSKYQAYKTMVKEDILYVFRPIFRKICARTQSFLRSVFFGGNSEKQK